MRRTVGVFALRVVVQHQHHEPRAIAGAGIFQHLPVAGRIAEGRARAAADHQVNALGLAGIVVVQEQLGLLGQERLAVLVVAEFRAADRADHLLGRNAIDLLRIDAHKILTAAGDDVGLEAVVAQIVQNLLHRLIGEVGIETIPARMFRGRRSISSTSAWKSSTGMPVSVAIKNLFEIGQ